MAFLCCVLILLIPPNHCFWLPAGYRPRDGRHVSYILYWCFTPRFKYMSCRFSLQGGFKSAQLPGTRLDIHHLTLDTCANTTNSLPDVV